MKRCTLLLALLLSLPSLGHASITLAWEWSYGGSLTGVTFRIQRKATTGGTFAEVGQVTPTTGAPTTYQFLDTQVGVPNGEHYVVHARTTSSIGPDSNELILTFTATQLAWDTPPASGIAGQAIPTMVVGARDGNGNPVSSFTGTVTVTLGNNPTGATLDGTTMVPAIGGQASFNLDVNLPGAGYTLVASAAGLSSATSPAFSMATNSGTHLQFVAQPGGVLAGAVLPTVTVRFLDAGNQPVSTTETVTLTLGVVNGGAVLGGTVSVPAVNGLATFPNLTVSAACANCTLEASAPVVGGTGTLDPLGMVVVSVDSAYTSWPGFMAIDNDPLTMWHTPYYPMADTPYPHQIILDTRGIYALTGLTYLPRQDGDTVGTIAGYAISTSMDGTTWGTPVATGTWASTTALKTALWTRQTARYVKLVGTSEINGLSWASAAEVCAQGLATSNAFTILAAPAGGNPTCAGACHM